MSNKIKVLVVGCGNMGAPHATSYHHSPDFEIVGLVSLGESKFRLNKKLNADYPLFEDFYEALEKTQPEAVCISTYPDTHAAYAIASMEAGAHVFVEKPLADTLEEAEKVVKVAEKTKRKLVVGYILRHHPSWQQFVQEGRKLGTPLVFRMNLNQQSNGVMWNVHKNLMQSVSPIVDCGVHYVDVMCQMTDANPLQVSAIGARLTDEIPGNIHNYGQLQITFDDGSVGWYEAGWGPMVSETAFFVKDVFGPKGSVSIVADNASSSGKSDDVDSHTKTEKIKVHSSEIDENNNFIYPDRWLDMEDEPNHQELCDREQAYFLQAIREDLDLSKFMQDALNSLKIVLAADESMRTRKIVSLI